MLKMSFIYSPLNTYVMNKFMNKVVFVCAFLCTLVSNGFAQSLSEITETKRVGNRFFVVASGATMEVSPVIFKAVSKNKSEYALATIPGDASATTVVLRTKATSEIVNVDSISLADNNEDARLFLSNGEVYENSDPSWLTVLPGQHVEIIKIDGLTKVIARYHTVARDVALSKPLPLLMNIPAEVASSDNDDADKDEEKDEEDPADGEFAMTSFFVPTNIPFLVEKKENPEIATTTNTTGSSDASATTFRFAGLK